MTFRKNYFVEDLSKAASQKISFQPAKDLKTNFFNWPKANAFVQK